MVIEWRITLEPSRPDIIQVFGIQHDQGAKKIGVKEPAKTVEGVKLSLQHLLNTVPCVVCKIEQVQCGRMGDTGNKKCNKCKNREEAEKRRLAQYGRRNRTVHYCIYCHDMIGTQKTKYCGRKCQQRLEQLNRARKKVKSLKDKMLYQRRVNTYQRKRVYVLNNYDKVAATKAAWKIKHKVKRSGMLDQVLKDDL